MKNRILLFIFCVAISTGTSAWAAETTTIAQEFKLKTLKLSEIDRDAITRVTYAEAGNQGDTGLAAVVFVILNRLVSGKFGSSVTKIINAKNQFEPATVAGGWENLPSPGPQQRARIDTIINLSLDGRLPDPTNGSLYFQNPAIVALRETTGEVSKGLTRFNGSSPATVIRDHEFYAKINRQETAPVLVQAKKRLAPEPWDIYGRSHLQNLQKTASWDVFAQNNPKTIH